VVERVAVKGKMLPRQTPGGEYDEAYCDQNRNTEARGYCQAAKKLTGSQRLLFACGDEMARAVAILESASSPPMPAHASKAGGSALGSATDVRAWPASDSLSPSKLQMSRAYGFRTTDPY
jgi:hypothetical protein